MTPHQAGRAANAIYAAVATGAMTRAAALTKLDRLAGDMSVTQFNRYLDFLGAQP